MRGHLVPGHWLGIIRQRVTPQTCLLPILTVPGGGQVQLILQQDLPNGFGFQSAFAVPHQFASDQTLEDLNTEGKVYFMMA